MHLFIEGFLLYVIRKSSQEWYSQENNCFESILPIKCIQEFLWTSIERDFMYLGDKTGSLEMYMKPYSYHLFWKIPSMQSSELQDFFSTPTRGMGKCAIHHAYFLSIGIVALLEVLWLNKKAKGIPSLSSWANKWNVYHTCIVWWSFGVEE